MEIELRFWIGDPAEGVNNVRSDVNRRIWALFRAKGITIPPAQREIRILEGDKSASALAPRDDRPSCRRDRRAGLSMIPEGEYTLSYVRSPGPGGQNVNKVSSACELRFDVAATSLLDEAGKQRLRRLAGRRLTQNDEIVIEAHRHRGQEANRRDAIGRLEALVEQAPHVRSRARRRAPGRAAKARRLDGKSLQKIEEAAAGQAGSRLADPRPRQRTLFAALPRGRSHAPSAGSSSIAPSMFTRNMNVSMRPTSAWNLSGENTQVATPIASVMPVKKIAAPVTRRAAR